jgi:hypothetical protein
MTKEKSRIGIHVLLKCSLSAAAFCIGSSLQAQTFTFQDGVGGYSGTEDTFIENTSAGVVRNYGANQSIPVGYNTFNIRRALMRFDLTSLSLAPGESVSSASITLNLNAAPVSGPEEIGVYEVALANAGWVEGTANGTRQVGSSSFNYRITESTDPASTTWLGGSNGALDGWPGSTTPMDTATINTGTILGTDFTFNLDTALVESWITNSSNNAGVIFSPTAGPANSNNYLASFDASEDGTIAVRPRLEVSIIPEPSAAGLLVGMAALAFALSGMRRRR